MSKTFIGEMIAGDTFPETSCEFMDEMIAGESGGSSGGNNLNITDFSWFHYQHSRTDLIGLVDTSACTDFTGTYANCDTLEQIPWMNTSNGLSFKNLYNVCKSIKTVPKIDTSKGVDFTQMYQQCESLEEIPFMDTSNGTLFKNMFWKCESLKTLPQLDTGKGVDFTYMAYYCTTLKELPPLNTSNGELFTYMVSRCYGLESVHGIDLNKATDTKYMFNECSALTNLTLHNIRITLTIGSGTSYGHLLTVDSLVHTIKELCKVSAMTTLTMGSANLAKIAELYCKVTDSTTEKIDMELCESTDEGAMTLSEYAQLKNWQFK